MIKMRTNALFLYLGLVLLVQLVRGSEERDTLERDGFVVLKNVLGSDMLKRVNDTSNILIESDKYKHLQIDKYTGSLIPLSKSSNYAELIAHDRVLDIIRDTLGFSDIRWMSGFLISKPPKGPSLGWHQDSWYWDDDKAYETSPAQLFAMYYLTDTRVANGCLRVIPGTHIKKHRLHDELGRAHSNEVRSKSDGEIPFREKTEHMRTSDCIDVGVKAGDVVIGDARVLHGANENLSDERRSLITIWYVVDFDGQSENFKEGVKKLHETQSHEIVLWDKEFKDLISPLLPGPSEERASGSPSHEVDEYNHNLDFMVRDPGFMADGDQRSRKVYQRNKIKSHLLEKISAKKIVREKIREKVESSRTEL